MESKTRHDLRHPLATISMIASTIAVFGDEVDPASVASYTSQVVIELDALASLVKKQALDLPLHQLGDGVARFLADPTAETAKALDEICQGLISGLSSGEFDGP